MTDIPNSADDGFAEQRQEFDPLTADPPTPDPRGKARLRRKPGRKPKGTNWLPPGTYQSIWSPQKRADGTPGPQYALLSCPFQEIFFGGARGGGKSLPLDENVMYPDGYRKMEDVVVGDVICGPDGETTTVLGIYPQGVEDVFCFTLVDGRTVRASADHRWLVKVRGVRTVISTARVVHLLESCEDVLLPVKTLDHWVAVASIAYDGRAETQCIKVDRSDGLFITNDDIVTHNTDGAIGVWLEHAARYGQHAKGLFLRRQYANLKDVLDRMNMLFPKIGASFNKGEGVWIFPNGANLKLGHLWDETATNAYQGHQYSIIFIEEVTHWGTPAPIDMMRATLRSAAGVPTKLVLTGNPGGAGHCVPFGEVLTPDGWKDITEFEVGDPVMTVSAQGELLPSSVSQVHNSHYRGMMANVSARGLNMVCTPNHKVAKVGGVKLVRNTRFSLVPFDRLPGQATILRSVEWRGTPLADIVPDRVETRPRKLSQPKSLSGKLYCSVLGWMLSEGYSVDREKAFGISQSKIDHRQTIRTLLEEECGFKCCWSASSVLVHCPDWWGHFRTLGNCRTKRIPSAVKQATKEELWALFEAMMDGDGHWATRGQSGTYYTISKQLADDVSEVAVKLGYVVSISNRQRPNRNGLSYEVCFKKSNSGGTELLTGNHLYNVVTETKRRSDIEMKMFEGDVFCIGVPDTHSFVIRQNGSIWISGNSWVKERYVSPAPQGYTPITDSKTGAVRIYIPSRVTDNLLLMKNDPNYVTNLKLSGSENLVRAWLEGDWNIVAGGFFSDIIDPDTHYLKPFEIPAGWRYRRSFDWGSAAPSALGIWAISDGNPVDDLDGFVFPRGSAILVKEWYTVARKEDGSMQPNVGQRLTNLALGNGIGQRSLRYNFSGCVADPSIFAKPGRDSIYDEMRKGAAEVGHTLILSPADNNRIAGWQRMRDMLQNARKPIPEKEGMWVFETCSHWIRTVPVLQRDEAHPDDIDTSQEDHMGDSSRYLAQTGVRSMVVGSLYGR